MERHGITQTKAARFAPAIGGHAPLIIVKDVAGARLPVTVKARSERSPLIGGGLKRASNNKRSKSIGRTCKSRQETGGLLKPAIRPTGYFF